MRIKLYSDLADRRNGCQRCHPDLRETSPAAAMGLVVFQCEKSDSEAACSRAKNFLASGYECSRSSEHLVSDGVYFAFPKQPYRSAVS